MGRGAIHDASRQRRIRIGRPRPGGRRTRPSGRGATYHSCRHQRNHICTRWVDVPGRYKRAQNICSHRVGTGHRNRFDLPNDLVLGYSRRQHNLLVFVLRIHHVGKNRTRKSFPRCRQMVCYTHKQCNLHHQSPCQAGIHYPGRSRKSILYLRPRRRHECTRMQDMVHFLLTHSQQRLYSGRLQWLHTLEY